MWSFLLIDLHYSLASPGSPQVSSDFCSLRGEGHMDVCACMHACVRTCVPGSVWAIWSPSLSLCSSLRVITAPELQIQTQWANSQPCPHQLCDLGQGAQLLCASILICDTGWEHQRLNLMRKYRQNRAENASPAFAVLCYILHVLQHPHPPGLQS